MKKALIIAMTILMLINMSAFSFFNKRENYEEDCVPVTWKDLLNNPEQYEGKKIKATGLIEPRERGKFYMMSAMTYVELEDTARKDMEGRDFESLVTVYGTFEGRKKYAIEGCSEANYIYIVAHYIEDGYTVEQLEALKKISGKEYEQPFYYEDVHSGWEDEDEEEYEEEISKVLDHLSEMHIKESSCFSRIGYDPDHERLYLNFITSGLYVYYRFPNSQWIEFEKAESKGEWFNENIKGKYNYEKLNGVEWY